MNNYKKTLIPAVVGLVLWSNAHSTPLFDFEVLNSGMTFGPLDRVTVEARVTNTSTAGETIGGGKGADLAIGVASAPAVDGYLVRARLSLVGDLLNPGESAEFVFGTYSPWFGAVSPGVRTVALSMQIRTAFRNDPPVVRSADFTWTVASIEAPEPTTLALAAIGLAGLGFRRWTHRCSFASGYEPGDHRAAGG